jgi:hypothetical protein
MSKVLLASLVTLAFTSPALADEPAKPAPGAPVMNRPTGCPIAKTTKVMFAMRTLPKKGTAENSKTTFDLYDNGAWMVSVGGQVPKRADGCLDAIKLSNVKTALGKATWKTSRAGVACDAIATHYTEYLVGTKVVFRREMCDGIDLDKVTEKALADVTAIVNPLIGAAR